MLIDMINRKRCTRSKEKDVEAKLKDYENLKRMISRNLKEPLNPTEEIRKMRKKQYSI
ncbi:MAG: hypothetical protein N2V78_04645 [Methanophagales archaeon]|nr:hypothetical protein [Methanophagales archaeon]